MIDHVLEGENPAELRRAVSDPCFKGALDIRTAAQMGLTALDADDRWKGAMTAGPTGDVQAWSSSVLLAQGEDIQKFEGPKIQTVGKMEGPCSCARPSK